MAFWANELIVLYSYVLVGVGHVVIAFIYMYRSPRTSAYFKFYSVPVITILCYALAWYVMRHMEWALLYVLGSFILFCTHYYWDEMKLVYGGFKPYFYFGLLAVIAAMSFLYVYTYATYEFFVPLQIYYLSGLYLTASIGTALFLYHANRDTTLESKTHLYIFTLISIIVPLLLTLKASPISYVYIASVVIMFHYLRWYFFYHAKTKSIAPPVFRQYQKIFFGVNIAAALVFAAYLWSDGTLTFTTYIFHPIYFYAMANLHVIASFIKK